MASTSEAAGGKKFKLRVPHVYTIIFALMAVMAILTWVIPSGSFERA